ncbi:hypothetical protein [Jeotgalibacillus proteolyticus]|uniref:DUF2564 domain-containing protein n=1 Tax=Jeotgalibacillus proteolyticus TaxID=2082395 RepID=A0A2S5G7G7_9BACL|nr:hypothetical protein [Jeotgalibacillus proteolyticus]PPA68926.1 hypothetical protein C4B60_18610 [Jeotgalibacillus proteolyticus]
MENRTDTSWKDDEVILQLSNSVNNAIEAAGLAQTNPSALHIQEAKDKLGHAERACENASSARGDIGPIRELKEQLIQTKENMNGF